MSPDTKDFCRIGEETLEILKTAISQFHLSARSYYKILKLARTIADLENEEEIASAHVAEALQYRPRNSSV